MITANFNTYASYVTDSLYQWDLNQVLSVSGLNLSVAPEVHFANANMDKAIAKQAELIDHKVKVQIPNSLLQEPLTIKAYIGIYEADTFKIIETVSIPVKPKARPKDYRIETTDEEIYSFEALKNAIANMVKSSDFESDKSAIQARIDNIIAHNNDTNGNSELIDMRTTYNGKVYGSAGEAIRKQFEHVTSDYFMKGSNFFIGSKQGNFPYTDVDDFPVNSVITNGYVIDWLSNMPADDFIGVFFTFSHSNTSDGGGVVQMAFRNNGRAMFTRVKWNKWSAWEETLLGDVKVTNDKAIIPTRTHINNVSTSPYASVNDFPPNTIIGVSVPIKDSPTETAFGTCITLNFTTVHDAGSTQLFYSRPDHTLFVRNCWGNNSEWDSWQKLLTPSDISELNDKVEDLIKSTENYYAPPLISSFLKIGCIGDSLASGESVYKKADGSTGYADLYDHSWGQFLARKYGIECINFSAGGLSTRSWLTHSRGWSLAQQEGNLCNAYIIGLGQNDIGKLGVEYLGTIDDIDLDNHENNADTYYGNYGKIIQLVKTLQPKAKFFLLTDPLVTGFNEAIIEIANKMPDCYLIDLTKYSDMYKLDGYFRKNNRGGHYNSVAYNYMGKLIGEEISKYMYDNPDEFNQIEFIGTDYTY